MMILKKRVMDPKQKDDISEALAFEAFREDATGAPVGEPYRVVPAYVFNWYPAGLRERTVGPNSRQLVGITRFYPTMKPKIAVDFEPAPPDRWYAEEKRRFCAEQQVVYVPVYLGEKLTEEEFKARVDECRRIMLQLRDVQLEDRALQEITVEGWLQQPDLLAAIDAEALRQLVEEERTSGKCFRGVAKAHVLRRYKQKLVDELRGGLKSGLIKNPMDRFRPAAEPAPVGAE
jgi:hypothetical protein